MFPNCAVFKFVCSNSHEQEIGISSLEEFNALDKDDHAPYIECNVRYGDMEHPRCEEKAYLTPVVQYQSEG